MKRYHSLLFPRTLQKPIPVMKAIFSSHDRFCNLISYHIVYEFEVLASSEVNSLFQFLASLILQQKNGTAVENGIENNQIRKLCNNQITLSQNHKILNYQHFS